MTPMDRIMELASRPKPTIRLKPGGWGYWECIGSHCWGGGNTPRAAFENWWLAANPMVNTTVVRVHKNWPFPEEAN